MMKTSDVAWTAIGITAVVLSGYLLYHEIRNLSLDELADSLQAIGHRDWLLATLSALGAYAALAWYDRIALAHLGKHIPWWFITLCSFTTYALAHNIGASVFSGALVRYRAYRSKGLTPHEIGVLIIFCSLTFMLGALAAAGMVLVLSPQILDRLAPAPSFPSVEMAYRLSASAHRRPTADSRSAGAGLRSGDHLFRAARGQQSRLSGGNGGVPCVFLPGPAVARARRARRA